MKVSPKEYSCNINKEQIYIKDIQSSKEALLLGNELVKIIQTKLWSGTF